MRERGQGGARRWRPGRRAVSGAVRAALLTGLCALLVLPAGTTSARAIAAAAEDGSPEPYAFAPGAAAVAGAPGTATAPRLEAGRTYRSSLASNGELYYRIELRATDTAYVPVTAVPPADATVSAADGIAVSLQDAHGTRCSYANARFGAGLSPRPLTALARREPGNALCQGSGTYYVVVQRLDAGGTGASAQRWDLEIAPATEPRTARAGATSAPQAWDSATPEPLDGEPHDRPGGAGFASASTLGQGVWRTSLVPGETRFYKVPVDWGRQLHASAELGNAAGHGYVGGALDLSLYNPVRGYVEDAALGYTGTQKPAVLAPVPPVEYANRYAVPVGVTSVRFAGDYYLVLHLSERMTGTFGRGPFAVTLRVRVTGRAHAGPEYAGHPVPDDVFTPTRQGREAALTSTAGGGSAMLLVAIGGIGLGTVLLLVLAGWTVTARRAQTRVNAQKPTA
ncbi:hypothetical protein [Streptomyces sp. NBC_00557]|uniref:hypothetical protein n=1 Tax=Streptomyces sp. NBC_00557 TaxID=2975776 RepID=UPI002E8150F5|nr:hypothetical protein [Streptomyces sp. NBC_00557]WUC35867.1 hypothetical protein OG956_17390 [Streptomyces sp. NBC_00557]